MRGAIYAEMVEKDFKEEGMEGAREIVQLLWREGMAKPAEIVEGVGQAVLIEREKQEIFERALLEGAMEKEKEREPQVGEKRKGKAKVERTDGGLGGGQSPPLISSLHPY